MSASVEGIRWKFANWKDSLESIGLKITVKKTTLMLMSGSQGELSISKIDPCGVCGIIVATILCVKCGNWIQDNALNGRRLDQY